MHAPSLDLTRSDYLGARVLLGALTLGVPLTWAAAVHPWLTGHPLTQTVSLDGSAPVTDRVTTPGVTAEWSGSAQLTFADATTGQWLAHLAPGLLLGVAMLLVLVPLWRLIGAVQRQEGFRGRAVVELRVVALTVMLAPWVLLLVDGLSEGYLLAQAFADELTVWVPVSGATIAVSAGGLVIAVVAEAFRRGTSLERDVEGLV